MLIPKFTDEARAEWFEAGKNSLFTYARGILGFEDMTEDLHGRMCLFLEGKPPYRPWTRAQLVVFRGGLKSSIATIGYVSHCAIYQKNHATKLVEQSADNAKKNHFRPIVEIFRHSKRADFLFWLYGEHGDNPEFQRIPDAFEGWNESQIVMLRDDPLSKPSITYGGIDTAFEGWHGNLVLGDDLEGADADKRVVPPEDAYRFISQRAVPLLINPLIHQVLNVGTPHGDNPNVHRIKDWEDQKRREGKRIWEIFWQPVINSSSNSAWPERFTEGVIEGLKLDRTMWDTQYMLLRRRSSISIFDMERIEENLYKWASKGHLIGYTHCDWNLDELDSQGYPSLNKVFKTIALAALRISMHCDPKHKDRITDRHQPSEAAIVIPGTAPDGHTFVLETWAGDCGLEAYAEKVYWFYRKWRPRIVTMEAVGAQTWFWDYARLLEKGKYRNIISLPQNGEITPLPKLTSRLVEAEKKHQKKEEWIISQLESWFNFGMLHLHESQEHLLAQVQRFPDPAGLVDLLDALSHGPSVWPKGFASIEDIRDQIKQSLLQERKRDPDDPVGYIRPWEM